nr:hypothetical protein [Desulfurobacterium thermolithotrophum]
MKNLKKYFCFLSYLISLVVVLFVSIKIINIRSKCTYERSKISKLINRIEQLKEENNRMTIEFYRKLRPEIIDSKSKDMKLLHENEVKYLK